MLDICTDLGPPALADRAEVRPSWEADLEGEKVVNESQSQLLVGTVQTMLFQEKGSTGKELGSEKETWGKRKVGQATKIKYRSTAFTHRDKIR